MFLWGRCSNVHIYKKRITLKYKMSLQLGYNVSCPLASLNFIGLLRYAASSHANEVRREDASSPRRHTLHIPGSICTVPTKVTSHGLTLYLITLFKQGS